MTPKQALFAHISSLLVGVSGVALFVFGGDIEGEFGPESHILKDDAQAAHILTAPALVFACALIWQDHIWTKFKSGARARRRTGILLGSLLVPMILSGYLIQVSDTELWREIWRVSHLLSSLVWMVAYGVHQLSPKRSEG